MKYLCIFSNALHETRLEKEIREDAQVSDEVRVKEGDEELGKTSLVDYDTWRFTNECRTLGGDWNVFVGDKPFEWPVKAEEKAE